VPVPEPLDPLEPREEDLGVDVAVELDGSAAEEESPPSFTIKRLNPLSKADEVQNALTNVARSTMSPAYPSSSSDK